ncbi:hypothetical protein QJS66_05110 [Kocuria rhizophila]|nr:hypothetical protein QJS66_05110 [Kocuria rhizophila]
MPAPVGGASGQPPRVLAVVAAASLATLLVCGYAASTGSDRRGCGARRPRRRPRRFLAR